MREIHRGEQRDQERERKARSFFFHVSPYTSGSLHFYFGENSRLSVRDAASLTRHTKPALNFTNLVPMPTLPSYVRGVTLVF